MQYHVGLGDQVADLVIAEAAFRALETDRAHPESPPGKPIRSRDQVGEVVF